MDKYKRSITQVSNFIILYFKNKGLELTPMKLQKILYYLQAWHIAYFDKKLLFEELPQAWNSGPVYETIFKKYEDVYYNNVDITNDIDFISNMDIELEYSQNNLDLDKNELKVFYAVLQYYGMMSHDKLVFLTHAEYP